MQKKIELIQQALGWLIAIMSALVGIFLVVYGESIQGSGYLLVAIALLPLVELPIIIRVIAATIGLVFL